VSTSVATRAKIGKFININMYKSDQKLLCNTTTNHLGDGAVLEWEYLSVQDGHNS